MSDPIGFLVEETGLREVNNLAALDFKNPLLSTIRSAENGKQISVSSEETAGDKNSQALLSLD